MTRYILKKSGYAWGVFYFLIAFFVSALNDAISKKAGIRLGGAELLFFRFFFSMVAFLPLVLFRPSWFVTRHVKVHALRGGLFALAMLPWSYGLIALPMPLITSISFTTPLFVIFFAHFFLKETVGWARAAATILGFVGMAISVDVSFSGMSGWVLLALGATVLFAILDIINKRLLSIEEGILPLMFYSAFWTTVLTAPLGLVHFVTPSWMEMGFLLLLGIGANASFGCLLKAFSCCDISALQPIRYTEFLFSCAFSYLVFNEWPTPHVLWGVCLIIPSALYLGYHESMVRKAAMTPA